MKVKLSVLCLYCATFVVASCASMPVTPMKSRAEEYRRVTTPAFSDSRSGMITSRAIQMAHRSHPHTPISLTAPKVTNLQGNAQRGVLALGPNSSQTTSARISGVPAWNYFTGKKWWLAEDGNITEDNGGTVTTHHIQNASNTGDTTDEFPKTSFNLGGTYADFIFCTSKSNKVYVINTNNWQTTDVKDMSGASSVVDLCPAPWVYGSDVYAVNNDGLLYNWSFNESTGALTQVATLQLPHGTSGNFTTYYRTSVISYGGKLWVASWKKHSTTPNSDTGFLYQVDTSTFTVDNPGFPWTVGANFAPPSLELDDYTGAPLTMFVPGGKAITMIDLANSTLSQCASAPLVISATAAASNSTGHPSSLNSTTGAGHRISNQVVINAIDKSVYVANCNAAWKLSYASPTYDGGPYSEDAFSERTDSFTSTDNTCYTLSYNGVNQGVIASSHYIANNSMMAWDQDSNCYMLDNYGQPEDSTHTALTRFTDDHMVASPLQYNSAYDLTANAPSGYTANNEVPGMQINYLFGSYLASPVPDAILFGTGSHTSGSPAPSPAGEIYDFHN